MNKKIEELEIKLAELEEEIKGLKEQEEKEEVRKYPKWGDVYYKLDEFGDVYDGTWDNSEVDLWIWDCGNGFFKEEEAKFENEHRKVIREMEEFSKEFEFRKYNHYCYWDYEEHTLKFNYGWAIKYPQLYFESVEKVAEMLDAVGVDRVIKYYLGVEDE